LLVMPASQPSVEHAWSLVAKWANSLPVHCAPKPDLAEDSGHGDASTPYQHAPDRQVVGGANIGVVRSGVLVEEQQQQQQDVIESGEKAMAEWSESPMEVNDEKVSKLAAYFCIVKPYYSGRVLDLLSSVALVPQHQPIGGLW